MKLLFLRFLIVRSRDPQIVRELVANKPYSETAAGQFLGLNLADDSSSPSAFWAWIPYGFIQRALNFAVNDIIIPQLAGTFTGGAGGGRPGGVAGAFPNGLGELATTNAFETRLPLTGSSADIVADPLSSVDQLRARGLPTDLASRTAWARERGILHEPGSSEFGNAIRRTITRELPL
jgi:hypothetical protein